MWWRRRPNAHPVPSLLAVDLGLRTGLALYGDGGRLVWYRSQNFGSQARLKRAAHTLLSGTRGLAMLVIEGGGPIGTLWRRTGERLGLEVLQIGAETWRERLLYPREQRTGVLAKRHADDLARRIIDWSGAPRPTSLRHDAAEAILIGLWGVIEAGWLPDVPSEMRG